MKYKSNKLLLAVLLGMGFPFTQLQAQTTVAFGDLVLFFQKPGDTNTVYVNLGSAATLYRGAAIGPSAELQALNIININTTLTTAFGGGWASDTGIFAGLAACASSSPADEVTNGDQNRTVYASRARTAVGTVGASNSTAYNLVSQGNLNAASTSMVGLTNNFAFQLPNLNQGRITDLQFSSIDDANPTSVAGVQSAAFGGQFISGVQQRGSATAFGTFGAAGQVEFALDLQRLVPDSTVSSGEIAGTSRTGSYEGTVVVGTDGNVSFITQGIASAYTDWATTNGVPGQAIDLDHDNDGASNGVEYFLVGPSTVSAGFTSVPGVTTVSGVNSVTWTKAGTYTGVYGTNFWVETSTSLAAGSWTNETLGVNVVITGNNVKYTFPSGPVKTFARLKVTGP